MEGTQYEGKMSLIDTFEKIQKTKHRSKDLQLNILLSELKKESEFEIQKVIQTNQKIK